MGRGKNYKTDRYYALEAFFYDDDLLRFARYLCTDAAKREIGLTVVLNGDIFDLLRIEPEKVTSSKSVLDRRFGAPHTPTLAARTIAQILQGHRGFVQAIAEILRCGHEVIILPGNHDIEVQWAPVQNEIRHAIASVLHELMPPLEIEWALSGLKIDSWFYYEPGRIWIEHGCQYDPENAYHYYLRGDLSNVDDTVHEAEHDMPLGNFFQKYLYNGFGHVTFIVPTSKSNPRYIKWLLLNQPSLFLNVMASHLPFALQVLRRLAKTTVTQSAKHHLQSQHEKSLRQLANTSGLGNRLLAIEKLKAVNADVLRAIRSLSWQFVMGFATFGLVVLSGLGLWFVGLMAINALNAGFILKTVLFMALNLFMLITAAGALAYSLLKNSRITPVKPIQRAAQRIIDILDVPIVTFGHTHEETATRLQRPHGETAWYYNTGTWIAVFTHDVLIPRERVQYTFLRVRGNEPELLHWSPDRGEPLPVILLDEKTMENWGQVPVVSDKATARAPPKPR
ncbi:MAG: hypothetical protein JW841_13175 [Deltaproteobacteria bacterium]|nr:hypothetical protein [Deltaproteobacteria bacterium]